MNWKPIKDFVGIYDVSNLGEVRRVGSISFLKKQLNNNGYHKVILYNGKFTKNSFVHRLVAQAFISNPENKPAVNHLNAVKTDNRVKNLEWCTAKENHRHAKELKLYKPLYGSKHGMASLTEEIVIKIREYADKGNTYVSIADFFGVDPSTIRRVVVKQSWKHIWTTSLQEIPPTLSLTSFLIKKRDEKEIITTISLARKEKKVRLVCYLRR